MSESPKAVFLSYSSPDADAARRICAALRAAGHEVWFDQSELRGGDAWDASIRKQIRECALFVPVISANTEARSEGYFRLEWKLAVDRSHLMADDQAFLLPVVIDATSDVNARVPPKFRDVQWTRLPGGEAPAAFAERVHRLLSGATLAPASQISTPTPPAASATLTPASQTSTLTPTREAPSIAVLPFANRGRDEDDEYFADGLADELVDMLAKIRGLRVAARTSSFQFKGKNEDVAVIGKRLNVGTVLEGSVRKSGNRLRIGVQLVNVSDGFHLWSETYDRTLEDIFAVQDDIAQSVVKELRAALLGGEPGQGTDGEVKAEVAAAAKGRGENTEAHRLYLQGRFYFERRSGDDMLQGVDYFRKALDLDPGYALVWAWYSKSLAIAAAFGFLDVEKANTQAREAAQRALQLEPELAEGHLAMAYLHMYYDWDWKSAEAAARRAMQIAPGDSEVLHYSASLAFNLGRMEEALALSLRAVEQNPLSVGAWTEIGMVRRALGRHAESEAAYRKAMDISPQRVAVRMVLALVVLAQGRGEEALAHAQSEPADWARNCALAIVHHALGHTAEADAALRELIETRSKDAAYQIACTHAVRGETDAAFEWLERSYVQHDSGLSMMQSEPVLRPLHGDARWGALIGKMGFAE